MKRISDFPDYKNCIIGYFRIRTTRVKDVDTEQLYQKFTKVTFVVAENNSEYLDLWLRYQAHIFLMDEFKNKPDLFFNLYSELLYSYYPFYKRAEFEHFKSYYPEQLFFNVEVCTAPLRVLVTESGYPNRTLCYCYNYLLSGWNPKKIASQLCFLNLDVILDRFLLQYVNESGINKLFVDYMFLPLRKKLNETLYDIMQLYGNDDEKFTCIIKNILNSRTGSTLLEDYFGVDDLSKRSHMISVWCSRIKNLLIKNIIRFIKNQEYYLSSEREVTIE